MFEFATHARLNGKIIAPLLAGWRRCDQVTHLHESNLRNWLVVGRWPGEPHQRVIEAWADLVDAQSFALSLAQAGAWTDVAVEQLSKETSGGVNPRRSA